MEEDREVQSSKDILLSALMKQTATWLGMVGSPSKMMASALGTEFCQQAVSLEVDAEPQVMITALADTLISACETLSQEPSYALPRLLIHRT